LSDKIWLGGIYLKDEGGYEIILRSLIHYKKRLMTVEKSPEIKDSAAMFGGILRQAAMKTIPKIDEITLKIQQSLPESQLVNTLNENIPFLEKALSSYEADIQKAQNTGHEYYLTLVGDLALVKNDIDLIKIAKSKINQFE
jgi:GTP:adenosylcobinamide-phosphate guanylyltransferase